MVLPSIWVRCFVLQPKIIAGKRAFFPALSLLMIGFAADLFVLFEQLLISWLPIPQSRLLFLLAVMIMQGLIIFDGYLVMTSNIRMEVGYLHFCRDIGSFWDSGKDRSGFTALLPLLLLYMGSLGYFLIFHPIPEPSLHVGVVGAILGLVVIFAGTFLPMSLLCDAAPISLRHQFFFLRRGKEMLLSKKRVRLDEDVFFTRFEEARFLDPAYPLFRKTKGFSGDEIFSIRMEKDERPNIVFLFLESMRARDMGAYGARHGVTPNFDRYAKQGVLFENFYSNSVKTSRCAMAALFGMASDSDGMGVPAKIENSLISMADILRDEGYETAYLHNGALKFENQRDYFKRHGYDHVMGKAEIQTLCPGAPETSWGVHDEYMMRYGMKFLNERKNKPLFMTLFTISTHHPWRLPPGVAAQPPLTNATSYERYLQTVSYADSSLGLFLDHARRTGLSKNTIFFILGDHGFAMGEHEKNFNQQRGLYEEQVHVPLLVYADGRLEGGQRIAQLGSQLDLLPTVCDLLNLSPIHHAMGASLLRVYEKKPVFFHNPYMYGYFGVRQGELKLIYLKKTRQVELYDLSSDPFETRDLASSRPDLVAELLPKAKAYEKGLSSLYLSRRVAPL